MKKVLFPVLASMMVLGGTAAQAETRPSATRFSQPVADESSQAAPGTLLAILALIAAVAGGYFAFKDEGNSAT